MSSEAASFWSPGSARSDFPLDALEVKNPYCKHTDTDNSINLHWWQRINNSQESSSDLWTLNFDSEKRHLLVSLCCSWFICTYKYIHIFPQTADFALSFLSWTVISLLPTTAFLFVIKIFDVSTNLFSNALFPACWGSSYHSVHIKVHLLVRVIFTFYIFHFIIGPSGTACAIYFAISIRNKTEEKLCRKTALLMYFEVSKFHNDMIRPKDHKVRGSSRTFSPVGAALPQSAKEPYASKILSSSTGFPLLSDTETFEWHLRAAVLTLSPAASVSISFTPRKVAYSGRKCCQRCCQLRAIQFESVPCTIVTRQKKSIYGHWWPWWVLFLQSIRFLFCPH